MAKPEEWGPILWNIIHITCENLGNNQNIFIQNDEIRQFKLFQEKLYYVLPCKICKIHYQKYLKENTKAITYSELKEYGRTFYLNLHNEINVSNSKPLFKFEDLEKKYNQKFSQLKKILEDFNTLYSKYITFNYLSYKNLSDFLRTLSMLHKFMNFK